MYRELVKYLAEVSYTKLAWELTNNQPDMQLNIPFVF